MTYILSVAQLRRSWCERIAVSPEEMLKRRKLRELLSAGG
jgi:hypothetical protein